MNRYFYTITVIVFFIFLVFSMNVLLEGGNQAVRAIYRFAGENPRVSEISQTYRAVLLGSGAGKDFEAKNSARSTKETGILVTPNLSETLPRDPKIGNIIDTTLANLKTTDVSGNAVLAILAKALDMPEDNFMAMYDRIVSVPDITRLAPEEQNDPVVVEVFYRRDRIQTQIINYLSYSN